MTRDIATKFNETYGKTFVIPSRRSKARRRKCRALTAKKMSKSYGNTIEIFGDEKALRKKSWRSRWTSRTPPNRSRMRSKTSRSSCSKVIDASVGREWRKSSAPAAWLRRFEEEVVRGLLEHFAAAGPSAPNWSRTDYVNNVLADGGGESPG